MDTEPNAAVLPTGLGVVLLAAGRSRRYGQPKMLLPWRTTSILGHAIGVWRALGAEQVAVVCGSGDEAVTRELDRLDFPAGQRIENPAPDNGMFSSVRCAAQWRGWRRGLAQWAIVLGDQPHVRPETLRSLQEFAANHPGVVCQPARHGRARHPVVIPARLFESLADSAAADLKEFLSACPRAFCEVEDPGLDLDIDTPADYAAALAREASVGLNLPSF